MNDQQKMRTIRSFVRRSGRLTPAQQRALDVLLPRFGVATNDQPIGLERLFGREAGRVLEIGFGDGESLLTQAAGNPELDYLGIEVHEPGVGHCLLNIEQAAIKNVRVLSQDANEVLELRLQPATLARINLYFPDPWPKKRHHKRRIVNERFLALCRSRLQNGGALHVATDWAEYAEHIDEIVARSDYFRVAERREHSGERPLSRPNTKFERRGLKKGHRIVDWRLIAV